MGDEVYMGVRPSHGDNFCIAGDETIIALFFWREYIHANLIRRAISIDGRLCVPGEALATRSLAPARIVPARESRRDAVDRPVAG
jgi:hypothetical protein